MVGLPYTVRTQVHTRKGDTQFSLSIFVIQRLSRIRGAERTSDQIHK